VKGSTLDAAIGKRICRAREEAGIKQEDLGLQVGLGQDTISLYEKGRRSISLRTLMEIARALDYPMSYFLDCGETVVIVKGSPLYDLYTWASSVPNAIHDLDLLRRFLIYSSHHGKNGGVSRNT